MQVAIGVKLGIVKCMGMVGRNEWGRKILEERMLRDS